MQVFQQGIAQEYVVSRLTDDRRDRVEAGPAAGTPAAFARDELEMGALRRGIGHGSYDDRLEQADLGDRVHELGEGLLVEDSARLTRVGAYVVEGDLGITRPADHLELGH